MVKEIISIFMLITLTITMVMGTKMTIIEDQPFIQTIDNPGVKVTIQQGTIDYLTKQMLPFITKQLGNLQLPDINTEVKTPIGHVSLSVTAMHLNQINFPAASIKIVSGNQLHVVVSGASASAHANWHYREKSWPHISDHGSADMDININVDLYIGAVLDPSHKSGIRLTSSNFNLHFNHFGLHLHGGASWLYNIFIGALKGSIEHSIESQLHSQIPKVVQTQLQQLLDDANLQVNMPFGVLLKFDPREISFVPSPGSITVGSMGAFVKPNDKPYPNTPTDMPDSLNNKMIQIFISDYVLNSAGWAYQEAGVMKVIIHPTDIPKTFPLQLNTTYFSFVAPGLADKYPNNLMQVTVHTSEAPKATMDTSGITIEGKIAADFQVIMGDGSVESAFVTELDLIVALNGSMKVVDSKNVISGTLTYKSVTGQVTSSNVGKVDFDGIFALIEFFISYVVVPLVDTFTEKGFVIPSIQSAKLINPTLVVQKGYLVVYSDFTWAPSFQTFNPYTPYCMSSALAN